MAEVTVLQDNNKNHTVSVSSASSLDSGVFTVQFSSSKTDLLMDSIELSSVTDSSKFTRHTYLDVKPLSWRERVYLAILHYANISNGIRILLLSICLGVYVYFVSTVLSSLTETVVHLESKPANESFPPAITICTHCALCSFPDNVVRRIGAKQFLTTNIKDFSPKEISMNKDIRIDCWLAPHGLGTGRPRYDCDQLVKPVISAEESRKCTTFFSDITGQTQRALQNYSTILNLEFDRSPTILLTLSGNYIRTSTISTTGFENIRNVVNGNGTTTVDQNVNTTGLYFSIHDKSILPYMLNMPVKQLMPGKKTMVPFVKRVQHLLPAPYAANCTTYNSKFNSSDRYQSRGNCIITCLWAKINEEQPCSNFYSIYTAEIILKKETQKRMMRLRSMIKPDTSMLNSTIDIDLDGLIKICPKNETSFQAYVHAKEQCLNECPIGCLVETFEDHQMYDIEMEPGLSNSSQIRIFWYPEPVVYVYQSPKWQINDLLGNIGAMTYFWLSFSVLTTIVHVFKFIQTWEILPRIVCRPLADMIS